MGISRAIEMLKSMGQLNESVEMTELGWHAAALPLSKSLSWMIRTLAWAVLFGVVDDVLTILAARLGKEPFAAEGAISEKEVSKARAKMLPSMDSDHVVILNTLKTFRAKYTEKVGAEWCAKHHLKERRLHAIGDRKANLIKEFKGTNLLKHL